MSTTTSRIYAWGANSHGQLGVGFTSELCSLPVALPLPTDLCADDVIEIRGGGGHLLLLTRAGSVFACGWNNRGQCGGGGGVTVDAITTTTTSTTTATAAGAADDGTTSTECKTRLTAIDARHFGAQMVRTIRAGWDCSAALTASGDVFVWGSNLYGLLAGDRDHVRWSDVPRKIPLPGGRRCVDVQFGLRFAAFLTDDDDDAIFIIAAGKVHTQLAKSTACDYELITAATDNSGIITFGKLTVTGGGGAAHLACGGQQLIYCANDGAVRGIGDNRHGQCEQRYAALLENDGGNVKQLRSGWTHCGALRESGAVALWGRNVYGQLGRRPAGTDDVPTNVLQLPPSGGGDNGADGDAVVDLQLGAEHGLVRRRNGDVWTWGWNEHGNCGNGDVENCYEPVRVRLPGKCWLAGVGAGFCVAVVRE